MAAAPRRSVAPRGSPASARTCCSNWSVAAPSIVQWPLLWTRGASSFTTSDRSGIRNSSTVSVPTRSSSMASRVASAWAARTVEASTGGGAGATDSTRIPASWRLRATGKARLSPSAPRATMADTSQAKSSSSSRRRPVAAVAAERREPGLELGPGLLAGVRDEAHLAPAVVAADRSLEPERRSGIGGLGAQLPGGPPQVVERAHFAPGRDRGSGAHEEPSLGEPVLGHPQRVETRPDVPLGIEIGDQVGVDVLQLVRDDVAAGGHLAGGPAVVVAADDHAIGHARRRAGRIGIEDRHAVAHPPRGHGQHPAELATAEDADGRARSQRLVALADAGQKIADEDRLAHRVADPRRHARGHDRSLHRRVRLTPSGSARRASRKAR